MRINGTGCGVTLDGGDLLVIRLLRSMRIDPSTFSVAS